jgi:hypothetical protein
MVVTPYKVYVVVDRELGDRLSGLEPDARYGSLARLSIELSPNDFGRSILTKVISRESQLSRIWNLRLLRTC